MDDLDEYIMRLKARPWWQKAWEYFRYRLPYILRHLPRDITNIISRFTQRGRKGWSRQDVWNLDHHLSLVIPQMLRELMRQTDGFSTPISFIPDATKEGSEALDDDDNKQWIAWLDKVASAFEDYHDLMHGEGMFQPFDKERYKRDLDAMRELFDHFSDLWS